MPRHVFLCPLRWSDTDANQHINNVELVRYLEEARVRLHQDSSHSDEEPLPDTFLVAQQEISYLRPLVYRPQPVTIETWITAMARITLHLAYEIKDADQIYARATSTLFPIDTTTRRPRKLTPREREALSPWTHP
ncbi:acyl-CoA thioesterase [Streptomyces sp. NPDC087440]|uniref:acyl-CoA thioesterase n=1 Tax=Streptomyces sp. NPDC087440 TaxID=3365790 RepID=UPI00380360EE